jgi:alpha-tubulin suppressor-like RCC1 family protein
MAPCSALELVRRSALVVVWRAALSFAILTMAACGGGPTPNASGASAAVSASGEPQPPFVPGAPSERALVGGCALRGDGTVLCWGLNLYGLFGTERPGVRDWAQPVPGVDRVTQLVQADDGLCALRQNAAVRCWGRRDREAMHDIAGTEGATAIDGGRQPCVVVDGEVRCWRKRGDEASAQTKVTDAERLVSGEGHRCAIRAGGRVTCWPLEQRPSEVPEFEIAELENVEQLVLSAELGCALVAGAVTCFLLPEGEPMLPIASATFADLPAVERLSAYDHQICMRTVEGALWCFDTWACDRQDDAPHLDGAPGLRLSARRVEGAHDLERLLDGGCGTKRDGTLLCWDSPWQQGQTERAQCAFKARPVDDAPRGVVELLREARSGCAVLASGEVMCWGDNSYGQLGTRAGWLSTEPASVKGLARVRDVAAGHDHACALHGRDKVSCWGEWKNKTSDRTPVAIAGLDDSKHLFATYGATCAVAGDGVVSCWGDDQRVQARSGRPSVFERLGSGERMPRQAAPQCTLRNKELRCDEPRARLPAGKAFAVAKERICRVIGGSVTCRRWENGAAIDAKIPGPRAVKRIAIGEQAGCAVAPKKAWCWKFPYEKDWAKVREVPLFAGAKDLAFGGYRTGCAVLADRRVACFGENDRGQLGDGSLRDADEPKVVADLSSAKRVVVGGRFACALLTSGALRCWGARDVGQLGDGVEPGRGPLAVRLGRAADAKPLVLRR